MVIQLDSRVKVIRVKPELTVGQDARDFYIGKIGTTVTTDIGRSIFKVKFDDDCIVAFKREELVRV